MTKHDYKQNTYYLMYLIRCVLNYTIPAKEKLDKMDLSGVFAVAKAHSITAIAAYALESAGIVDKDFEEEKFKAIRKNIILDTERETVLAEFENAGIWYMPLKGSIIKDMYPQIGMRQMADNDILFDKTNAAELRGIMERLGFSTEAFDEGNHDIYYKPPVCNFEMHTELFGSYKADLYEYYSKVTDRMIKNSDNSYGRHLSDEDFYIYITAHAYKHYSVCGTGLRALVDTYVYLTRLGDKLDAAYIHRECQKLGIAEFEQQNRELALNLLGGKKLTAGEREMLDYYIFSGTYGNVQNRVQNSLKSRDGAAKTKYLAGRVFVPIRKQNPMYSVYAARYKWFYKNRARLPLLFFYRIGIAMTRRRNVARGELKALMKIK